MAVSLTAPTFTKAGAKAATQTKLDTTVFGQIPENHDLLKLAYNAYLANGRVNLAVTKTRGKVSGGGRKPWKQKGTGRARFGSSRNPIWRGGGIVFGPTGNENYSKVVPTATKRRALRYALSLAAAENRVKVVDSIESKEGKLGPISTLLGKLDSKNATLLVVDNKDELLMRATRNLQNVKVVNATYLNVFDILNADSLVITPQALDGIVAWLGEKKPTRQTAKKDEA